MAYGNIPVLGAIALVLVLDVACADQTITLRNGVRMPMVAAGTFLYNNSQAEASVDAALSGEFECATLLFLNALQFRDAVGFHMFDTATDYNNQVGVGRALSKTARGEFFLMTKVPGCGEPGVRIGHCYEDTKTALSKSLQLLNVTFVDAVLLHTPPTPALLLRTCTPICDMIRSQWQAMVEFYNSSRTRAIGVSNYCDSCMGCLEGEHSLGETPMINQVMYNFGMGSHWRGLNDTAHRLNLTLQAYSPLGSNLMHTLFHESLAKDPDAIRIAAAHNRSIFNLALKFITDQAPNIPQLRPCFRVLFNSIIHATQSL